MEDLLKWRFEWNLKKGSNVWFNWYKGMIFHSWKQWLLVFLRINCEDVLLFICVCEDFFYASVLIFFIESFMLYFWIRVIWHDVKVWAGTQYLGTNYPGTWDPRPPCKFNSGTPGLSSKFKSGTLIIIFLHYFTFNLLCR